MCQSGIGMNMAWPEFLAVCANDSPSSQKCACSSQSITIVQAGLKLDLVQGLKS